MTENHEVELTCEIGGPASRGGWGLATLVGDDALLDGIVEEIRRHPSVGGVHIDARQPGSVRLTVNVVRCKACAVLMQAKAFMVFPVDIHKGRMKWLLVTDGNRTAGALTRKLELCGCDVTVERLTTLRGTEVLTGRQEEVLRKAFAAGYFDYPRKTGSSKLAAELGISASTLSEVLRAAQRRILAQYLRS